jgi:hypothetical protein
MRTTPRLERRDQSAVSAKSYPSPSLLGCFARYFVFLPATSQSTSSIGCPGLDFETWDRTNPLQPRTAPDKRRRITEYFWNDAKSPMHSPTMGRKPIGRLAGFTDSWR